MTTQPPKPAARNRADVSAHTARSRRSLAILRQLAEEAGYLDRGPYLSGLDEMLAELESGAARLTLEGATAKIPASEWRPRYQIWIDRQIGKSILAYQGDSLDEMQWIKEQAERKFGANGLPIRTVENGDPVDPKDWQV